MLAEIRRLAVPLDQLGLEVEEVDVAGGPGHEELDHPPGPGRMVQAAVGAQPGERAAAAGVGGEQAVGPQQGRERDAAQASTALPEEIAPVHERLRDGGTFSPQTRTRSGSGSPGRH